MPQPETKPVLEAVNDAVGALSALVRSIRAHKKRGRGGAAQSDDVFSRLEKAWAALKGEEDEAARGDRSDDGGRARRGGRSGGRSGSRATRGRTDVGA